MIDPVTVILLGDELDQLRAENAELSRLIKDVAIPALEDAAERDALFDGEADVELTSALATLQEAVK